VFYFTNLVCGPQSNLVEVMYYMKFLGAEKYHLLICPYIFLCKCSRLVFTTSYAYTVPPSRVSTKNVISNECDSVVVLEIYMLC